MRTWRRIAIGVTAGALVSAATAMAQTTPPPSPPAGSPQTVEGQVVAVDKGSGKVTIKGSSGQTYEFQASQETLKDLKVGDRITAQKRQ